MGGTALPDLQDYYLVSQLSHFYYFNTTELQCYRSLICSGHQANTPIQAILRGGQTTQRPSQYNDGMLMHQQRVWGLTLKRHNPLPHLFMA